jgi:hypothetical protein
MPNRLLSPVEDKADAARPLDGPRLSGPARRPRQGQPRRRGDEEPPRSRRKDLRTLEGAGIEAAIVSTSPIKIACHVPSTDVDRAVQALHEAFELG